MKFGGKAKYSRVLPGSRKSESGIRRFAIWNTRVFCRMGYKCRGKISRFAEGEAKYSRCSPAGVSSTEGPGEELRGAGLISPGHHADALPWQR